MNDPHDELTSEERAAFQRLPRELEPPVDLRGRIRSELRRRGHLTETPGPIRTEPASRASLLRIAAAAGAFFLLGLWVGRQPVPPDIAGPDDWTPAERIQATGTAYVDAIANFRRLRDSDADPTESESNQAAGGAALSALRAAAEKLADLPELPPETTALLRTVRAHDPAAAEGS